MTPVALTLALPSLAAVTTGAIEVHDTRSFLLSSALSLIGVCGFSAVLCTEPRQRSWRNLLWWALVTGALVGFLWFARVSFSRMVGSGEGDLVAAGPFAALGLVGPETRAFLTGSAVGALVFRLLVAAIEAARRDERRRWVERRRRLRTGGAGAQ